MKRLEITNPHINTDKQKAFGVLDGLRNALLNGKSDKEVFQKCAKCGKKKQNPSSLCYKCNRKWNRFMKKNPLSDYKNLRKMRKESDKRWHTFLKKENK